MLTALPAPVLLDIAIFFTGPAAVLVRSEEAAKDVYCLRGDLGHLHRDPHNAQWIAPLRFTDTRMETAFLNRGRSSIATDALTDFLWCTSME